MGELRNGPVPLVAILLEEPCPPVYEILSATSTREHRDNRKTVSDG